ncbi:MAG: hypothetical protein V1843_02720 [bacterium]
MKDKKHWFKVVYAVTAALGVILGIVAAVFSTKNSARIFEKTGEPVKIAKKELQPKKKGAAKSKKKKSAKK